MATKYRKVDPSKAIPPAFLWYSRDWLASESRSRLTLEAQAAYRNLLDHAWLQDGLPAGDPDTLRRMAGATPREWSRIWRHVEPLFESSPDGRLRSSRQEIERAAYRSKVAKAQESAESRWKRTGSGMRSHDDDDATAYAVACANGYAPDDADGMREACSRARVSKQSNNNPTDQQHTHTAPEADPPADDATARARAVDPSDDRPRPTGARPASNTGISTAGASWGAIPTRNRKAHCAYESAIGLDVPAVLHSELLAKACNAYPEMAARDHEAWLLDWYAITEEAYVGRKVGDDAFRFWRARFRETFGTTVREAPAKVAGLTGGGVTPKPRATVAVIDPDYRGAEYRFHCGHAPTCTTWPECRDKDTTR